MRFESALNPSCLSPRVSLEKRRLKVKMVVSAIVWADVGHLAYSPYQIFQHFMDTASDSYINSVMATLLKIIIGCFLITFNHSSLPTSKFSCAGFSKPSLEVEPVCTVFE